MPERTSNIDAKTDPSVTKQYDNKTSTADKFKDFYALADNIKTVSFNTYRPGVGPVGRSMAVAKRTGPDFLFLANKNSTKFRDLEANKEVQLSFRDGSKEDWISVTGEAVTLTNDDPRIKEIYSKPVSAWFGDIGDGVHDGGPEDPRMALIEVQSKYIAYWQRSTGAVGFMKEIAGATLTGGVANTGDMRELQETEIKEARVKDSALSS
ncbi:Putative general stress protein, FMN-binding split barrel [Septoria linicola]|uniref:General stress protein, FMN-binding split barrel n=1 Tax=Septoria linicola TaxID=215465 RepID=A0A9Q9AXX3_9PEZI|nr:putative general stress protein, FMN-binding split barrel [Septoria linicola]USW57155.1 Putative general stress protein, FMN-binding split barrel [Septoria linicola]